MIDWLQNRSFRLKLVAAAVVAVMAAMALLAWRNLGLLDEALRGQTRLRIEQTAPLLNAALAVPLVQRDYSAINEVLQRARVEGGIEYLVLFDRSGRVVAGAGWDLRRPLPALDPPGLAAFPGDARLDIRIPIALSGREYGTLHYGVALGHFAAARAGMLRELAIGSIAGVVLAALLLAAVGFVATARLARLNEAGRRLGAGDLSTRVADSSRDELGQLAQTFNAMAASLEARINQLNASEQRLALVIRGTTDGIWDWDLAENRYYLSPRYLEMLGYGDGELPGTRESFLEGLHPEDRPRVEEAVRRHFEQRVPYDIDYRLRSKDGSYRWFRGRGQAVWDEAGRVVRFSGASSDITAEKTAEEQIRRLNEELEQRVQIRTAELTAANRELESFSYSVSHDLVAPLRAIDGFSRMLEEDCLAHIDAQGQDYIRRIRRGTLRMHQLIDDLLSLSRVTRDEMRRMRVDLSGLAQQVLAELKQQQPQRRVETHITFDIYVHGDPNLLRIVMENLLRNAWKFTARRACAKIEVGALQRDGERVYFVRDDGAGFDMKYAGKLFGAFQRMHRVSEFEGTGVGLATVQRIVQRHGGRIWADAAPDQGATFYFTLS